MKIEDELNSQFLPTFIVIDVFRGCSDGSGDVTPSDDECPASRIGRQHEDMDDLPGVSNPGLVSVGTEITLGVSTSKHFCSGINCIDEMWKCEGLGSPSMSTPCRDERFEILVTPEVQSMSSHECLSKDIHGPQL